ncbi:hypothetical protein [Paenibacillus sp.]|uniref:hypothetical protein n=1 Tax=Paenibacillus sp. TaxID=58172 RepID=UPI00283964BA|nr:hypothetical protein [Paenibacillus sp.]MDR0269815.1 hypothetical protein [Paenibacillus sp.]
MRPIRRRRATGFSTCYNKGIIMTGRWTMDDGRWAKTGGMPHEDPECPRGMIFNREEEL